MTLRNAIIVPLLALAFVVGGIEKEAVIPSPAL
jgi:hypothetical protein